MNTSRPRLIRIGLVAVLSVAIGAATGAWLRSTNVARDPDVAPVLGYIDKVAGSLVSTTNEPIALGLYAAPRDLDEVVQRADLIAIGTITRVLATHDLAPYNAAASFQGLRIPVTDYEVRLDDLMRGPRSIVTITLRVEGRPDGTRAPFPMPRPGDRNLLFLSVNADGSYGLFFNVASRMFIDGPRPTYSDAARRPEPFTSLDTSAFVTMVRAAAR